MAFQMPTGHLSRPQLIIIGVAGAIILFFALLFLGFIPGVSVTKESTPKIALTMWGVDPPSAYAPFFAAYKTTYKNITITYRQFDGRRYEQELLNALAAGTGPDIFAMKNTWLPTHYDKIAPLAETQFAFASFQTTYPTAVRQDFSSERIIYALPLYMDTILTLYNRDMLDRAAIVSPPATWAEFQKIVPTLVKKKAGLPGQGGLEQAAAAIGGSRASIPHASDLLSLIMLQYGTQMTDTARQSAAFGSADGQQAFSFYTQFANSSSPVYTWSDAQGAADDALASGKAAMVFDYYETAKAIRAKNPFLALEIAPVPQISAQEPVAYARYYGLTVSNRSANGNWAWHAVLSLAADPSNARAYAQAMNRLPALRALIGEYLKQPAFEPMARQALVARSWYQADDDTIDSILSDAIARTISGQQIAADSIRQAAGQVTELMAR